jgi:multisubunit Na+/H+ antiporter MnhE subunit
MVCEFVVVSVQMQRCTPEAHNFFITLVMIITYIICLLHALHQLALPVSEIILQQGKPCLHDRKHQKGK